MRIEVLRIEPTFVSVDQELLRRLHAVCASAIENASDCLAEHESSQGRTTRKDSRLAGFYEQDIREAKQALSEVRTALGWPVTEKPDEEPPRSEQSPNWTDGFEAWIDEQIEKADAHYILHPDATTAHLPIMLKMVRGKMQKFKREGAAVEAQLTTDRSFDAFEAWVTQEFNSHNSHISFSPDEATLRRDEELVHTIATIRRYKRTIPTCDPEPDSPAADMPSTGASDTLYINSVPLVWVPTRKDKIEPQAGDWTEGFEGFLKEQLNMAEMANRNHPCGITGARWQTLRMAVEAFQWHKGRRTAKRTTDPSQ